VVNVLPPLIGLLNLISNALVRLCRVTPRDELAPVHNREQLTHLVEESERLSLINESDSELLTRSLTEPQPPVGDLQVPTAEITSVDGTPDIDEILHMAADSDRTRLLVREGDTALASVYARDALVARAQDRATSTRDLAWPVPEMGQGAKAASTIDLLARDLQPQAA
jgi:CBS domain containing-hemolysin-like protein